MQVSFQQGIIRYPFTVTGSQQTFLVKSSSTTVDLQTSGGVVDVTFTYKDTNYLLTEATTVPSAWIGLPVATDAWLYWDIDLKTAVRTFNFTLLQPVVNPSAPASPVTDQHWFNTVSKIMYVWTGVNWKETVRVFAAKVNGNQFQGLGAGVIGFPFAGTQVGLNVTSFTGRIIFDGNGVPIRRQNGAFFTTEDDFFINGSPINTIRFEANVVTAIAAEVIPQFYVVKLTDFNQINLADYNSLNKTFIAMAMQNGGAGDVVVMVSQGTITNNAWNWSTPGEALWVLEGGALVEIDPNISDPVTYPVPKPPIARVITPTTIFFDQGLGGQGAKGDQGAVNLATQSVIGITRLSLNAVDPSQPIAVGDNDPRNSNARTPLPHTHNANEILTPTFDTITGATLDVQLPQIFAQVLHLNGGGTLTGGTLVFGAGSSIDMGSHPLTNVPTPGAGGDAANKIYVDSRSLDDLTDVQLTAPTSSQVLSFNGAQWVNTNFPFIPLSFLDLNDTPNSYTGQANLFVAVNPGATGLTFVPGGGGGGAQPLNQIVYGTGPSESSSPELIYNVVNGQFSLLPTVRNTPGPADFHSAASQPFVIPATHGILNLLFDIPCITGVLDIVLATPLVDGTELTGLVGITVYTATVTVDGIPYPISVLGSDAPDFGSLVTQIGIQLGTGFCFIDGGSGHIVIQSSTCAVTSTVALTLGTLFPALVAPYNFVSTVIIPGADEVTTFAPTFPTGLIGATTYTETITVDGIHVQPISFLGSAALTIATLAAAINADLGGFATAVYDGINTIVITSATTGITSTVATTQLDFLQTPGPVSALSSVNELDGQPPIPTQNPGGDITIVTGTGTPSGKIVHTTGNRIQENFSNANPGHPSVHEIYDLYGNAGSNLLTSDGNEIAILTDGNYGVGVFEILAAGTDSPAVSGVSALSIRGGYTNTGTSCLSVKETYVGGCTVDVSLVGNILRVTASPCSGVVWRARVRVTMLGGGGPPI